MKIIFNLTTHEVTKELQAKGVVKVSWALARSMSSLVTPSEVTTGLDKADRAYDAVMIASGYDCYHDLFTEEEKREYLEEVGEEYNRDTDYGYYPTAVLLDKKEPMAKELAYAATVEDLVCVYIDEI